MINYLCTDLMGNANGNAKADNLEDGFILVSNNSEEQLSFDPKKSVILSFGIDKQIHPNYNHKSLGLTVKLDAFEVTRALIEHTHINSFETFCSSDDPASCTHSGIEEMIKLTASKVEEGGIFILFFGGHGVNDGNEILALAPADFDRSPDTYITANTVNKCIEKSHCKAKSVLVILDCCYSGAMGSYMTSSANNLLPSLYVLAAGSAYESSFAVTCLHHSIFSYFFKVALDIVPWKPGMIPLIDIYEFCKDCTSALSSLILTIDNCTVKTKHVVPSLSHFNLAIDDSTEDVDGEVVRAAKPGRLKFVVDLFNDDRCSPRPRLHPATHNWLKSLICGHYQPIYLIEKRHVFDSEKGGDSENLLKTIVALIMQSIAVLEMFHNSTTVGEPDIFLIGFIHTLSLIDFVLPNCVIGAEYLVLSWTLYHRVLLKNNIDDRLMKDLLQKVRHAHFKVLK